MRGLNCTVIGLCFKNIPSKGQRKNYMLCILGNSSTASWSGTSHEVRPELLARPLLGVLISCPLHFFQCSLYFGCVLLCQFIRPILAMPMRKCLGQYSDEFHISFSLIEWYLLYCETRWPCFLQKIRLSKIKFNIRFIVHANDHLFDFR